MTADKVEDNRRGSTRKAERAPERSPGHVSRMPTPLATQAPDELGLKAPLQWEPPLVVTWGWTALEG